MSNYIRAHRLSNGDIFTIDAKYFMDVFTKSNQYHVFMPRRVFKKVIWYKPKTWFRKYIEIEYIDYEKHDEHDSQKLYVDYKKLYQGNSNLKEMLKNILDYEVSER